MTTVLVTGANSSPTCRPARRSPARGIAVIMLHPGVVDLHRNGPSRPSGWNPG